MQALLTNIELDIQELKYLMDAFSREPNASLRELLKRNILQMRARLDQLLADLDAVSAISTPILGERIRPVTDLRRSISLNDSFRFSRELFDGDSEQMNRTIEQISEMSSLEAATAFLLSKVSVGEENEAMTDLMELLKKYFD